MAKTRLQLDKSARYSGMVDCLKVCLSTLCLSSSPSSPCVYFFPLSPFCHMLYFFQKVAGTEGPSALYKGLSPFVMHLTLKYALRFGSFGLFKSGMGVKGDLTACLLAQLNP